MGKTNRLVPVFTIIILFAIVVVWTNQVQAIQLGSIELTEQGVIRNVINTYFEMRYHSHETLQLENFETLVVDSPRGRSFLQSEMNKLEIELLHVKTE